MVPASTMGECQAVLQAPQPVDRPSLSTDPKWLLTHKVSLFPTRIPLIETDQLSYFVVFVLLFWKVLLYIPGWPGT
jgi:hypothetical protein